MERQLRIYRLREGTVDEFVALWREHVVPARRALGFEIVDAWLDREERVFTWIARHPASEGIEAAERAYLASAEKAAIPLRPAQFFEASEVHVVERVEPPAPALKP